MIRSFPMLAALALVISSTLALAGCGIPEEQTASTQQALSDARPPTAATEQQSTEAEAGKVGDLKVKAMALLSLIHISEPTRPY